MSEPGEHVAPERVGAERMRPGRPGQARAGRHLVGGARESEGDGEQQRTGRRRDPDDAAAPAAAGRRRERRGGAFERGPAQAAGGEAGEHPAREAQADEERHARLEDRQVLRVGGGQRGAPEPGDREDRLDGHGTAGDADRDDRELREHGRDGAFEQPADDARAPVSGGPPLPHPVLARRRPDRVAAEPGEHAAAGQAHREGGQDQVDRRVEAVGGQQARPGGEDGDAEGGDEEVGEGHERGHRDAAGPGRLALGGPRQRRGAGGGGHGEHHGEGRPHERERDAQRGPDGLGDGPVGDPRGAEVAAGEPGEPVAQQRPRPGVEAEIGADGGERLRGGLPAGVAGAQDGQGGVAVGDPGQESDGGEEGEQGAGPEGQALEGAHGRVTPAWSRR